MKGREGVDDHLSLLHMKILRIMTKVGSTVCDIEIEGVMREKDSI
jgi:hypothetical protein